MYQPKVDIFLLVHEAEGILPVQQLHRQLEIKRAAGIPRKLDLVLLLQSRTR